MKNSSGIAAEIEPLKDFGFTDICAELEPIAINLDIPELEPITINLDIPELEPIDLELIKAVRSKGTTATIKERL